MTLETERLRLRTWRDADREPLARINADPQAMRWCPSILDRSSSDALLDRIRRHHDEHGWGLWAVERRADGQLLGWTGLQHVPYHAAFTPAVDISWRLDRSAWGSGYATEAARAVLAQAFDVLELDEVVACTVPGNRRSRAVMHRLGMRRDHAGNFLHPDLAPDHPLAPHLIYRIDRATAARLQRSEPVRGRYVHDLRHRCSVELRPDEQLDAAVRELAATLEHAGLLDPGASTASRFHPHVTLARASTMPSEALDAVAVALARSPSVTLDRASTFGDGRIIYLAGSAVEPLQHARLAALDHLDPDGIDPLVRARGWTPHVTVAYAVPEHARVAALDHVRAALPLHGSWGSVQAWDLDVRPTRRTSLARLA